MRCPLTPRCGPGVRRHHLRRQPRVRFSLIRRSNITPCTGLPTFSARLADPLSCENRSSPRAPVGPEQIPPKVHLPWAVYGSLSAPRFSIGGCPLAGNVQAGLWPGTQSRCSQRRSSKRDYKPIVRCLVDATHARWPFCAGLHAKPWHSCVSRGSPAFGICWPALSHETQMLRYAQS